MLAKKLTGLRFGRLVALEDVGSVKNGKTRTRVWRCKCDCGKETIKRSSQLLQGRARSCGCLRSDVARAKVILPPGEAGFNALFASYKRSATRRGYAFTLTKTEFLQLVIASCYYCGVKPSQVRVNKTGNAHSAFVYNGIDRLVQKLGYTTTNTVTCCKDCNYFKGPRDFDAFVSKIREIYLHRVNGF